MEEEKVISTKDSLAPDAVVRESSENTMTGKAEYSTTKTFLLAIAAGAFIAFGAQVSLTSMTGDSYLGWGFTKLIGAMTFTTGLMMVALTSAELFTGNVMMTFAVLEKKISLLKLLKSWAIVYIANFLGSILIAGLIYGAGLGHNGGDAVGVTAIQTAFTKINLSFAEAFYRGILCNWLVCLAIFMAAASKRVIGKIFALFFPIMAFAASGYEHSVANMFFIPNGIFMKNFPSIVASSGLTPDQLATMSWKGFLLQNLLPVTLGNIVGAFVFVVLIFWIAYIKEEDKKER